MKLITEKETITQDVATYCHVQILASEPNFDNHVLLPVYGHNEVRLRIHIHPWGEHRLYGADIEFSS
jgi:hypothetical protein